MLALSLSMSSQAFLSYGWRIPFLISFILVVVGVYIRRRVSETPSFVQLQNTRSSAAKVDRSPLRDVVRLHFREIFRLMLVFAGPTALFYLVVVFSLGYLTGTLGIAKQVGFAVLMMANACAVVGALCGGMLSDRIGRKKALALGACLTLVFLFIYFPLLDTRNFWTIAASMGFLLGFTQYQSGIQPVYFAEAFPTHVRYTGSALAYTAANLIAGATLPATAVWLLRAFHGSPWSVVGIVVFWNGLSLIMVLIGRETRGINLDA
jgi:MFS family permease